MDLCEVYIGKKFGHLRFQPWYRAEISSEFGVTSKYHDCAEIWYHEFAEESIWYTLRDFVGIPKKFLNSETMLFSLPNGVQETYLPCHVIAALHGLSYYHGELVDPSRYGHMLKWKQIDLDLIEKA